MKKVKLSTATITLFFGLIFLSSCKKQDVVVVQNMDDISQCLNYPSTDGTTLYTFPFNKSDVEAAFAQNGITFNLDNIKNAKVSQISAVVTTNAATFNDLAGFEVYLKKTGDPQSDAIQVAYVNNIANNATQVDMKINGSDLTPLLAQDQLDLVLRVTNKNGSGAPICIKLTNGKLEYTVSAK